MQVDQAISTVSDLLPTDLDSTISSLTGGFSTSVSILSMLKFILVYCAVILTVGVLARLILGQRSNLNRAVSASIGILFIYVVTIAVYTFRPLRLENYLSPLPFVSFLGDYLFIVPFHGTSFNTICSNIMSMIVLAFLVNLMDSLLPDFESIVNWYITRLLLVVLSMGLHLGTNYLINSRLPLFIVTYAPSVLLLVLLLLLLLSVAKLVLGIVLTVVNPIIGAIYAFFFSSHIGKQLTKSVLSTAVLCGVFYTMGHFGYTVIAITPAALLTYLPLLITLLILWFLLGHEI